MDLLTIAKKIADRVEAESVKQNVPVAVTVIDIHGNVVLTHRMTGAPAFSLELSERKAYTSALVGMRTADLVPLVQPGAELYPLLAVSGGRYSAMGGGVPLTSEDQVIAGVGVSGGTTEQDIAIVEAAMSINRGYRARRLPTVGRWALVVGRALEVSGPRGSVHPECLCSPLPLRSRWQRAHLQYHARSLVTSPTVTQSSSGLTNEGRTYPATRSLAIEYASRGVRVNGVSLGVIRTPMHGPESYEAMAALHPDRSGRRDQRRSHPPIQKRF